MMIYLYKASKQLITDQLRLNLDLTQGNLRASL